MYASKIIKTALNMAVLALAALCTAYLCSCNSTDTVSNFIDHVRPSAHFQVVDIHLSGDTLTYSHIRYPKPLR